MLSIDQRPRTPDESVVLGNAPHPSFAAAAGSAAAAVVSMSVLRLWLAPPSPPARRRILLLFLFAQLCDGVFTYVGVRVFGPSIEANPIVAWYIVAIGAGLATIGVKSVAIFCAAVLYVRAWHWTLGLLTVWYFAFAVWPWIALLAPSAFH